MGRMSGGAGASDRRGGVRHARPSSSNSRRPRPARADSGADADLDAAIASVGSPDAALLGEIRSAVGPRDKERAAAAFSRAVVALAAGDVQTALPAAREAKQLAPRAPAAREVLGIAAYRAGEFREALASLGAYRRMSGRSDQNHLIADAYRATGQPEKAVPLVREELTSDPPAPLRAEATAVGAAALADMGRFDEALALVAMYPSREDVAAEHDLRVWYVHADVLARTGRLTEAVRLFELVRRHDPGAFDVEDRLEALARAT